MSIKKILLYIFGIYTILGFFVLPFVLKSQIISNAKKTLNAELNIQNISFNPYSFNLKLSGIKLRSLDKKDLISFENIILNVEPHSLVNGAIHIKEFIVQNPKINLILDKNRSINLTSILKPSPKIKKQDNNKTNITIPRVILDKIAIQNGEIQYKDFTHTNEFDFSLERIGFALKDIDTKNFDKNNSKIRFYSLLEDSGFIDFKGDIINIDPFKIDGSLDFQASKLYTFWSYLQDDLRLEVADGNFSFHTDYSFDIDDLNATALNNLQIYLEKLRIKPKSKSKDILNLDSLHITDTSIKPLMQDINIDKIALNGLSIKAKRDKNSKIDWLEYLKNETQPASKKVEDTNSSNLKPWHIALKELSLEKIKVNFNDKGMQPNINTNVNELNLYAQDFQLNGEDINLKHFAIKSSTIKFKDNLVVPNKINTLDKITLNAYDISSHKNSWIKYDFSTRLNHKGYIKSDGKLSPTPLMQKGTFSLDKISLKEFSPYIQKSLYTSVDDGYLNIQAKTNFKESKKNPDLNIDGNINLNNIFISDTRDKSALLSLNNLKLKTFSLELFPNKLNIDNIDVNALFVNALINKDKSMNLSSLSKVKTKKAVATKSTSKNKDIFPINITKINIKNSSAKFADLSLPIEFRTNIHDLNGGIFSISNMKDTTSYIDIKGGVDKYGFTKLIGSINSANPKLYTDINFDFKNLELNNISGYSASFAGYKIDDGKLFLDLGYNIIDSNLKATNSIIIKNIKLGEEIKDDNITSLPIGFIVALLEDKDGVIDIDMPISGNTDEPDFKYGALVFKTLKNLIVKAVTSPFRFLGSMMGIDSDELEHIDFESGSQNILPSEKEKLDKLAKMMIKKPKINLSIFAHYDIELDKYALAKEKVSLLVIQKGGTKNKYASINILESIYKEFAKDNKLDSIKEDLTTKYKDDSIELAYAKEVFEECIKLQTVSEDELKTLAKSRANEIINYLINEKDIQSTRLTKQKVSLADNDDKFVKTKLKIDIK